jgi:Cupin domain
MSGDLVLSRRRAVHEREVFARNLAQLDAAETDPRRRLERFIQFFQASTIGCDKRMCLGAMLAVEQETFRAPLAGIVCMHRDLGPADALGVGMYLQMAGRPHRHPGPIFGYVLEGVFELALDNQPVRTLKAGETFYERSGVGN